ncbi:FUSC family protein [Labedella endophytica]|uniref:FUSC family protein n=1 Tax=Labedella endophytica TaxID=1523160 RepID=A0A3S0VDB7_9MICO|nr:FUSC family protein [Labedella endophytica]RUQ97171.1 FUSC family protein [Labedella endophytica]
MRRLSVVRSVRTARRIPFLQAVKTSIATVLAWIIAGVALPGELPVFAAVAALIVVQPSVNQSFVKAVERSVGVIAGVTVATGVSLVLGSAGWIVIVAIIVAIFTAWVLRLTPTSANQVAISAMLVLALGAATPEYAGLRIVETLIGAATALVVNALVVPPVAIGPVRSSAELLGNAIADHLEALGTALRQPIERTELESLMIRARLLRPMREKAIVALAEAEESLALNRRRARVGPVVTETAELLARLSALVHRIVGMTRNIRDEYEPSLIDDPVVAEIASQLERAGHDLRGVVSSGLGTVPEEQMEPPLLTAPVVVPSANPDQWILIGSLLVDLRRVREEIVGRSEADMR